MVYYKRKRRESFYYLINLIVYGLWLFVSIFFFVQRKQCFVLEFFTKKENISKVMETGFAVILGILRVALLPLCSGGKSNIDTTLIALLGSALLMTYLLKPSVAAPRSLRANCLITYWRRSFIDSCTYMVEDIL